MKIAIGIACAALAYGLWTGYVTPLRAIICVVAGILFVRSNIRELQRANQLTQENPSSNEEPASK